MLEDEDLLEPTEEQNEDIDLSGRKKSHLLLKIQKFSVCIVHIRMAVC